MDVFRDLYGVTIRSETPDRVLHRSWSSIDFAPELLRTYSAIEDSRRNRIIKRMPA